MKSKVLLSLSILSISLNLFSQQTILDRFQANVNNEQVYLSWTIEQGSTCNGIAITRSKDSLLFYEIGDIEGICGSEVEPVDYSYIDKTPYPNQTNFYRLELGDVGSSEIISIEVIILGDDGYIVIPNPVLSDSKIYFSNERSEKTELDLYDSNGRLVSHESTNDSFFKLNTSGTAAGLYLFRIYRGEGDEITSGKLVVP